MFQPSIYITRSIPGSCLSLLKKAGYHTEVNPKKEPVSRSMLLSNVRGRDALLTLLTDTIDEAVFKAAGPRLKIIANYAVGFDNIDLAAAKKHGVIVTNTPAPEVNESVAEHTLALLFALAHRLNEADHFTRKGTYRGWDPNLLLGRDIVGKTIGVIGTGRIGGNVIKRLADGFGVDILYFDQTHWPELEKIHGVKFATLPALLKKADFVSLHVPLLPSTHHLIGAPEFKLMKKTAYLINTSRGPVVDSHALVQALKGHRLAGAGLDVYEGEPAFALQPKDSAYLQKAWNVILTPHTASATIEAREAMGKVAAKNIIAVLSGKPALTPAQ